MAFRLRNSALPCLTYRLASISLHCYNNKDYMPFRPGDFAVVISPSINSTQTGLSIVDAIDRMHKWRPKKYSFVYVLIRLTSLALKQHFFCILYMQTRLVSPISI